MWTWFLSPWPLPGRVLLAVVAVRTEGSCGPDGVGAGGGDGDGEGDGVVVGGGLGGGDGAVVGGGVVAGGGFDDRTLGAGAGNVCRTT